MQNIFPTSLPPCLSSHWHYTTLAGHSDERDMYHLMLREYYRQQMVYDVYTAKRDCSECVRNKSSKNRQRALQLLPASGALEFLETVILVSLPDTLSGNHLVLGMTDAYTKSTRAVLTCKTTASHISSFFMDNWVLLQGSPNTF